MLGCNVIVPAVWKSTRDKCIDLSKLVSHKIGMCAVSMKTMCNLWFSFLHGELVTYIIRLITHILLLLLSWTYSVLNEIILVYGGPNHSSLRWTKCQTLIISCWSSSPDLCPPTKYPTSFFCQVIWPILWKFLNIFERNFRNSLEHVC